MLIEFGHTKVLCTASVEDKVPPFLKGRGEGWVTAEYGMLPRVDEHADIARAHAARAAAPRRSSASWAASLRAVIEMPKLGERTIWVDCDVIQADGGTRTASITGAFVAVADAVGTLLKSGAIAALADPRLRRGHQRRRRGGAPCSTSTTSRTRRPRST